MPWSLQFPVKRAPFAGIPLGLIFLSDILLRACITDTYIQTLQIISSQNGFHHPNMACKLDFTNEPKNLRS